VAFITVYFPKKIIAHVNVNWLSPVKVRTTLIGGEKKMLVWNDLDADEKIKIYDKGVSMSTNPSNLHQLLVSYRSGDMWAPQVEQIEALRAETAYFLSASRKIRRHSTTASRDYELSASWSRGQVHPESRRGGYPVNEFVSIAPSVRLGKDVRLSKFINLYGCEIGDETKIGAFVEIQKNASVGKRCKISSHTFICEGVEIEDNVFIGHSVTFINDSYPRSTTPSGELQTEADWKVEKTWFEGSIHRVRLHDSKQSDHR